MAVIHVQATYEEKETIHRVIVSKEYYEPFKLEAEEVVGRALAFLVTKQIPRQTEGMRRANARIHLQTAPLLEQTLPI